MIIFLFLQQILAIHLQFYIESQCKDTHNLLRSMSKLLEYSNLDEQVSMEFIIFGKGMQKLQGNEWIFQCQHGQLECDANLLENCIIQQLDWREQLEFLVCMHQDKKRSFVEYQYFAQKCAASYHCVYERSQKCLVSKFGNYLQHKAAEKTLRLSIKRVPWILLDGEQIDDIPIIQDIISWLCDKIYCEELQSIN